MPRIDKVAVLDALRERVQETLDALIASQKTVQAGAIHEENRQEDPKDTRAIEASYLARGLAERAESLRETRTGLATLRLKIFADDGPASTTALVGLSDSAGAVEVYFLVPFGGGEGLTVDDISIQTVTPAAPFGRALLGQRAGDEIAIRLPSGERTVTVDWIE